MQVPHKGFFFAPPEYAALYVKDLIQGYTRQAAKSIKSLQLKRKQDLSFLFNR
jgi:hypothetical protein